MKSKVRAEKPLGRRSQREGLRMWSKLQFRMAISFLGVTVVIVLLLELLIVLTISLILTSPLVDDVVSNTAKQTAHAYALQAAVYAGGTTLDPRSTFQPGVPSSIALPGDDSSQRIPIISDGVSYISHPASSTAETLALLIAPMVRMLAS